MIWRSAGSTMRFFRCSLSTVAVIPARYASSRFPGKPLARDTGKFLIQHVYERIRLAPMVSACVVATDDERIAEAVASFGGRVVMTRADHVSGTDRVAEAVSDLDCDFVLNVQGDEPEIDASAVGQLARLIAESDGCPMATLACPFDCVPQGDPADPNAVKVWIDDDYRAVTFTRVFERPEGAWCGPADPHPLLHVGIYAYRRDFLMSYPTMAPTPLERERRLEQLRALENGYPIAVGLVNRATVGVDTPEDYAAFVARWNHQMRSGAK